MPPSPTSASTRVLMLSAASHLGGSERSFLDLASVLARESGGRFVPWVVCPTDGELVRALRERGIDVEVIVMPDAMLRLSRDGAGRGWGSRIGQALRLPFAMIGYSRKLTSRAREKSIGLVHSNGVKAHVFAGWVGWRLGIPTVWHLREIFAGGWTASLLRKLARLREVRLIANSEATAQAFGREASVVHNGIDAALWHARGECRLRAELNGVPAGTPLVGIVGILARWKGQDVFLRAARELLSEGIDAHFVVLGGEVYDTGRDEGIGRELVALAEQLGIREQVSFLGFRKDVESLLGDLDVLVHASTLPEPFGRVIVEGMAARVPVVAARGGGVTEIIDPVISGPSVPGLLHAPGDAADLARQIRRVLEDPSLAERLRAAGSRRVREKFSLESHAQGVIQVYVSALRGRAIKSA